MIEQLSKAFGHIEYFDDKHIYIDSNTGEQLISVTTFLKKFQQSFPMEYQSKRIALKRGVTQQFIKDEWTTLRDYGTSRGTFVHNVLEDRLQRKHFSYDIPSKIVELELEDKFLAEMEILTPQIENYLKDHKQDIIIKNELIVCNEKIAGQVDVLTSVNIVDFKGLALDTPIATPIGYTNIENLKVGDIVFDGNGKQTKIQHVSEVHYNPCYKITFDTNDTLVADHEHKWVVSKGGFKKNSEKGNEFECDTDYLHQHFNQFGTQNKLRINVNSNLEIDDIELPIDPYVLGLWIADGNSHCSTVTCINKKCWEEVEKRGYETSPNLEKNPDKAEYRTIYNIRKHLKSLNLLKNKHFPDLYLRGSYRQRLDFLRGFIDGDGHYHKKRKRCVMITTKQWQADGCAKLVASLGDKPTIMQGYTSGFGKTNIPVWHVCFTPSVNPFLTRNQDIVLNQSARNNLRYIKKIEKIDTVPTKCISVDSKDSTYLAGYNLIKTHNTDKKIDYHNKYQNFKRPITHLSNCEFNKYSLQISLYRYLLELKGINLPEKDYIVWFNQHNDDYVKIELPYLKDEIIKLINL